MASPKAGLGGSVLGGPEGRLGQQDSKGRCAGRV